MNASLVVELQSENLKWQEENLQLKNEVNKAQSKIIEVQSENLKLYQNLFDTRKNFSIIEKNFQKEREEMSKIVENMNIKSNDDGMTPLHKAAKFGHFDVCKALLEYQVDKNAKGMYNRLYLLTHSKIYQSN